MKKKINDLITSKDNNNRKKKPTSSNISNPKINYIVVPYVEGLSERHKNLCKKYGIQVYFQGGRTIKDLLLAPKDEDHITRKSCIIYRYKCGRVECNVEYIGKSSRTFGERFREHLKAPSQYLTILTSFVTILCKIFQYSGEGRPKPHEIHKRINIQKGEQFIHE